VKVFGNTDRIMTIGGWKKADGKIILKDDFSQMCPKWVSINQEQIRDIYGFIETSLMAIECKFSIKHIPTHIYLCKIVRR
jgi:long-chain-fatty-acid---luciferin-component ligase